MKLNALTACGVLVLGAFVYVNYGVPAQRTPASVVASFEEVRDRVYADPYQALPGYPGVTPVQVGEALVANVGVLVDRVRGTLASEDNFKKTAPKLLHPMGVCATANWTIDANADTRATGLFRAGSQAYGLVRFSGADPHIAYKPGEKRIFGMAIKLFPSGDTHRPVESVNVFTLDQTGLGGEERASFLHPAASGAPLYFQNAGIGGEGAVKLLISLFKRFDRGAQLRALDPIASVDADGMPVAAPVVPGLVRFIPRVDSPTVNHAQADLREEILSYGENEISFDIWTGGNQVKMEDAEARAADTSMTGFTLVGSLRIGKAVASQVCDQSLHFHHHPMGR